MAKSKPTADSVLRDLDTLSAHEQKKFYAEILTRADTPASYYATCFFEQWKELNELRRFAHQVMCKFAREEHKNHCRSNKAKDDAETFLCRREAGETIRAIAGEDYSKQQVVKQKIRRAKLRRKEHAARLRHIEAIADILNGKPVR